MCNACPRKCNAQRSADFGKGYCGMGLDPVIARAAPHYWEEPCISGTNGSGTVFFSGCVLKCIYCQNSEISYTGKGKRVTPLELADIFKSLEEQGVHNINLVTPTHLTHAILKALEVYKPSIPLVYNCSGYESVETLRLFDGIVDIYLPDFKYYYSDLAREYSACSDYREIALNAIHEMVRQTGKPIFDDEGIMQKGTIVRHLVLPNCTDNSIEVLRLLDREFSEKILVSLMHQYYPAGKAIGHKTLGRKITDREYEAVTDVLMKLDIDGYMQDEDSADSIYTPDFDLE